MNPNVLTSHESAHVSTWLKGPIVDHRRGRQETYFSSFCSETDDQPSQMKITLYILEL